MKHIFSFTLAVQSCYYYQSGYFMTCFGMLVENYTFTSDYQVIYHSINQQLVFRSLFSISPSSSNIKCNVKESHTGFYTLLGRNKT